jgi:regulator of replication initiation timing
LDSFERTSENRDFIPKEVFKSVENINKTPVNQLYSALKKVEEKLMEIIGENEKINAWKFAA